MLFRIYEKRKDFGEEGYDCFELDYGKKNTQGYTFAKRKNAFCLGVAIDGIYQKMG
jgi:hypothetical protein